jgi:hypothetical protein
MTETKKRVCKKKNSKKRVFAFTFDRPNNTGKWKSAENRKTAEKKKQ